MRDLKVYGKGMINVLNEEGDSRIEWDPDNDKETEAAKEMFDKTIEIEGMKAYELGKDGKQGKEIKKFNPNAAKIIMVPRIAGG